MQGARAVGFVYAVAAGPFVHAPGIVGAWAAGKRAPKGDHEAHIVRAAFCQLAGVNASKAPADQADPATGPSSKLAHPVEHLTL